MSTTPDEFQCQSQTLPDEFLYERETTSEEYVERQLKIVSKDQLERIAKELELLKRESKAASELEGSKLKKKGAHYSLNELKAILKELPENSKLYKKTDGLIRYTRKGKLPAAKLHYSLEDLYQISKFLGELLPQDSKLLNKTKDCIEERREAERLNVPPFTKKGTTSTPKAPDYEEEEEEESELERRPSKEDRLKRQRREASKLLRMEREKREASELVERDRIEEVWEREKREALELREREKREASSAHYSLYELKAILLVLPEDSKLYKKTDRLIKYTQQIKLPAKLHYSLEDLYQISKFLGQVLRQDSKLLNKTKHLIQKLKERCYFSDLTEEQLMSSFREVRKFRFVLCKVFLSYNSLDEKARRVDKYCRDRRDYGPHTTFYTYDLPNDTAHGTVVGSGHNLFGSIQAAGFSLDPASPPCDIFNRQFNDSIPVSKLGCLSPDCYCSIPFSTSVKIAAQLYVTTDNKDEMNTVDEYYSCFRGGPKQFNEAFEICNDSAVINLSGYFANRPNGGSCSYTLEGRDGYLKLYYVALKYVVDAALEVVFHATSKKTKVAGRIMAYFGKHFDYGCSPAEVDDYKAMLFESKQPEVKPGKINLMRSLLSVPAQFSLIIDAKLTDSTSGAIMLSGVYEFFVPTDGGITDGCIMGNDCFLEFTVDWKLPPFSEETTLAKRSYYSDLTKKQVFFRSSSVTEDEEDGRWSLREEISLAFSTPVNDRFFGLTPQISVSISTGTEADECDYICTSALNIWPEIRRLSCIEGPKRVGLSIKESIDYRSQAGMLERCVVGGPGFLKFKLSSTWIAESIAEMVVDGGIIAWAPKLPIKTAIIHILPRNIAKEMHMGHLQSAIIGDALAGVLECCRVMVRRRFHYEDYLVTEDWDASHKSAWEQICKISRERLGICVKEEGKTLHDHYIGETRKLLREKGYNTEVEGDEVIVIEGLRLRLVDFAALWHSLEIGKADRIVHVADIGQRDKIEMLITAAESVGWNVTNHCHDPLSHVGFVQVKGVEGLGLVQLLDEAKSRCKAILVGKGKELEDKLKDELEDTAEALGYGAVKYEILKNNRLTDYTFSFDDMLKETGNTAVFIQKTHARICSSYGNSTNFAALADTYLALKDGVTLNDDKERQLGLHLLRFTEVLGEVCRVLAPHILCDYLFGLCVKFNELYSDIGQVLQAGEDSKKLLLFEATRLVIGACLILLRIKPIYKM